MTIRPFSNADAAACVALLTANERDMGDMYDEASLIQAAGYTQYWVAVDKKVVVGMVGLVDLKNGIGMLASLCVDPDKKGQGIGRKLLTHAKETAKRGKYRKLLLLTHEANKAMMILAIKEDFIPEGSLKNHFKDGKDVTYFSYFID